jgi:hypothetical protein
MEGLIYMMVNTGVVCVTIQSHQARLEYCAVLQLDISMLLNLNVSWKIYTPNAQIHDRSLSWLGTSIKCDSVKLGNPYFSDTVNKVPMSNKNIVEREKEKKKLPVTCQKIAKFTFRLTLF